MYNEETREIVPQELCCTLSLYSFCDYGASADHAQAVFQELKFCPELERLA